MWCVKHHVRSDGLAIGDSYWEFMWEQDGSRPKKFRSQIAADAWAVSSGLPKVLQGHELNG